MKRAELPILLVAFYAAAWFCLTRLPGDILHSPIAGSDLSSYYTAGWMVRSGLADSLYDVAPGDSILGDAEAGPWRDAGNQLGIGRQHYYIYPPLFALLVSPLSILTFDAARNVWLAGDLALLALGVFWYARSRARGMTPLVPLEMALIAVTIGLEFLPLIWALSIGQTSILLLASLLLARLLLSRGSEMTAGILVGIAAAIKLTPALVAVWLLFRGYRRAAFAAGVAFAASTILAAVVAGPAATAAFFMRIAPMMSGGTPYFLNQSLGGFFTRLLEAGDVRQVAISTALLPRLAAGVTGLAMLAFTARVFLKARQASGVRRPTGLWFDLEFSAILLLTLILSPISWSHHFVFALVPIWTIVAVLSRSDRPALLSSSIVGLAFLLIARKPHFELFTEGWARLGLSAALYGAVALWGLCLALINSESRVAESDRSVAHAA